ncbi:MAG: metallophosphoesterase [Solirubrobacteraceae bacterium]
MRAIERAGDLRFHCVGDTGGWRDPGPQRNVVAAMVEELGGERPAAFFYHLGDVVYPHGEEAHYGAQFYTPYAAYSAPIFAIPGNHDAEAIPVTSAHSLDPFLKTFCSPSVPLHDAAVSPPRPTVHQPHVHWTLVHDWLWIIGLYTNVPEGGQLSADQLDWLVGELRAAPPQATVILALHQPVYSIAVLHASNLDLGDVLDECFTRAGRVPEALFTAHSHNYQRFDRGVDGRRIPYVVAGSGGFWDRHEFGSGVPPTAVSLPGLPGVTLEACQCDHHGYMTVTVGPGGAEVHYRTVSGDERRDFDTFALPTPAGRR